MRVRNFSLYVMALVYIFAGVLHFVKAELFLGIVPDFLPAPLAIVYISGICEIAFGTMLLNATTRNAAAWLIILLLIAVFPANIKMATDYYHQQNSHLWIALLRLPLQFVLIWWAWRYTNRGSVTANPPHNTD
ncbi:DoxX family protein [Dyadobacter crusticola]|uniref:DoxX family protein n=1 Tax=Dyadobacter crusticola TaxID=292407 RepID=UPI000689C4A5|nr:DoxX family protein [Dyadobacter crusticola]